MGTNALGLIHELLLYGSDDELLDTAVPFLRAGFDVGEPGLLSCSEATTDLLRRELGDDQRLRHLNPQDIYTTPSGAMTAYQEIVDGYVRAGAVRVRLVAEAAFVPGRARGVDWARYEAVVNQVMRPYPVSAICAYDVLSTPPAMLVSAQATHPYLARGSTHAISPFYVEPAVYLGRTAPGTEIAGTDAAGRGDRRPDRPRRHVRDRPSAVGALERRPRRGAWEGLPTGPPTLLDSYPHGQHICPIFPARSPSRRMRPARPGTSGITPAAP